jgi:hypothetical protein
MSSSLYIPGVCNIGPAEIRYRRRSGLVGFIATLVVLALIVIFDASSWTRIIIFLPATLMAVGFLQSWLHFCVRFGMAGLFNFGDGITQHESVEKAEFRRKDQQKAMIIVGGSAVVGVIVTVVAMYI